jgi:hypothetical protein
VGGGGEEGGEVDLAFATMSPVKVESKSEYSISRHTRDGEQKISEEPPEELEEPSVGVSFLFRMIWSKYQYQQLNRC